MIQQSARVVSFEYQGLTVVFLPFTIAHLKCILLILFPDLRTSSTFNTGYEEIFLSLQGQPLLPYPVKVSTVVPKQESICLLNVLDFSKKTGNMGLS